MYRIGFIIVVAAAIVMGLLVGALNSEVARIDLLWVELEWPLGLVILSGIVLGILIGLGLSWLFSILPLRVALRKAQRDREFSQSNTLKSGND